MSPSTVVPSVKILALEVKFTVRYEARMLPSFLKCFPNVETLHIHVKYTGCFIWCFPSVMSSYYYLAKHDQIICSLYLPEHVSD